MPVLCCARYHLLKLLLKKFDKRNHISVPSDQRREGDFGGIGGIVSRYLCREVKEEAAR